MITFVSKNISYMDYFVLFFLVALDYIIPFFWVYFLLDQLISCD